MSHREASPQVPAPPRSRFAAASATVKAYHSSSSPLVLLPEIDLKSGRLRTRFVGTGQARGNSRRTSTSNAFASFSSRSQRTVDFREAWS
jgi:hypothetical protein